VRDCVDEAEALASCDGVPVADRVLLGVSAWLGESDELGVSVMLDEGVADVVGTCVWVGVLDVVRLGECICVADCDCVGVGASVPVELDELVTAELGDCVVLCDGVLVGVRVPDGVRLTDGVTAWDSLCVWDVVRLPDEDELRVKEPLGELTWLGDCVPEPVLPWLAVDDLLPDGVAVLEAVNVLLAVPLTDAGKLGVPVTDRCCVGDCVLDGDSTVVAVAVGDADGGGAGNRNKCCSVGALTSAPSRTVIAATVTMSDACPNASFVMSDVSTVGHTKSPVDASMTQPGGPDAT
jgi:hypothetical protein